MRNELAQNFCNKEIYKIQKLSKDRNEVMRVVLIGPLPPPLAGQSISFKMLCDGLMEKGIDPVIINIGKDSSSRKDGSFSIVRLYYLCKPFLQAMQLIIRPNGIVYITIAQSWNGFLRDLFFIIQAVLGKHKIILHLKGGNYNNFYSTLPESRKKIVRWTLNRAQKIIVLGNSLRSLFDFLPNSQKKIAVVYNGLPHVLKQVVNKPKQIVYGQPVNLLFLSNLIESKGYLQVLEAVRILVIERHLNIFCRFCGVFRLGSDTSRYKTVKEAETDFHEKISASNLKDRVVYQGMVDGESKIEVLKNAHFMILPTLYNNEGQPVAIIEALASGCVVISTRYRTIPEMLSEGKAGCFVDFDQPSQISDHIDYFIKNPDDYEKMSRNSIAQFENKFTREVHLQSIIKEILE